MSRNSILVGHDELGRFIRETLTSAGAREADAAVVAEGLVWANLRGGDGHGVSRLPRYLNILAHGEIDVKAKPRLIHDRGASLVMECDHGFGPVAVMQAAALAVARAKQLGVCFALIRQTTHTGAIGRYAQWIAQQDCAALILGAGPTLMAFHGARVASLSTSPIAIAVPSGNGPILLDMATAVMALGRIAQLKAAGKELPPGVALTAEGEPTTDAKEAETLLPLGGPKGSGLGLMFEMLTSVLAAAPIQARAIGPEKRDRHTGNTGLLVIDVATFRSLAGFTNDADALTAAIKGLPRQAGFDELMLPGERSQRTEARRRKDGIPIPAKLWEELEGIAKKRGLKMLATLPHPR